ncbi:MAG TPA: 1-acyl-sn-glycerol-3-phosphate acyltransferase [Planctomycetota bacterium]|nr:1-acyl-sn-glycerol-3-phosphate acyltransferase [Planctomycetota bacterium]
MRPEDRERATIEVACRVLGEKLLQAEKGGPAVDAWIHDTIYEERKRLERERGPARDADAAFYHEARQRALTASEEEKKAILRGIVERFVGEIAGNFDPRVYALATSVVPGGLALLLNALSPHRLLSQFPALPSLSTNVLIRGETETLKRLDKQGTVILCPTHSSNLDSIVVGWVLHRLGLPPYIYGAGLNLFSNPLLSFFMQNLGAYKVDRKKTATLYKDTLKEYCTVTLELGYDNLFFPGGTRSRSGGVESRLKLGLLGCGLRAYVNNLQRGAAQPKVFIVPCTLSYQLVLEAETLIDDYLKETGKARYVIDDDESSQLRRVASFLSQVVSLDSRMYLTVSPALDPFGNRVEADGESYDRRGRRVDATRYVTRDGKPVHDAQRDAEYTRELGDQVIASFRADNTLQSTNVVALTLFDLLRRKSPGLDLYRLLRTGGREDNVPIGELAAAVGRVVARIKEKSDKGEVRLDPRLYGLDADAIIGDALRAFASYHARAAVQRRGDRIYAGDMNLLFFYNNRAIGYGLEKAIDEKAPPPPTIDTARRPADGGLVVPKAPAPTLPEIPHAGPKVELAALAGVDE